MSDDDKSLLSDVISELPWYVRPLAKAAHRWISHGPASDRIQKAIELRCGVALRRRSVRVAFAVILKLSHNERWFLVRIPSSRHPDTFAPFGGVIHHNHPPFLDTINFVPDPETTTFTDGPRSDPDDLRGVVEGRNLAKLCKWWHADTREREGTNEALVREVIEELILVGLSHLCDGVKDLSFRLVRDAVELYPVTGLSYEFQYRHFVVLEAAPNSRPNVHFARLLAAEPARQGNVILASLDEVMRGKTRTGDRVAPHAAYLFGLRRNPGHG